MKEYTNADLADSLGNLLQRSTNLKLNLNQCFPSIHLNDQIANSDLTNELIQKLSDLPDKVYFNYKNGNFHLGIDNVMTVLHQCNKLFFEQEPWRLIKNRTEENEQKLNLILYLTYETLRITSILLSPIVPTCTETVFNKLSVPEDQRYWKDCKLKTYDEEDRKFSQDKLIVYQKVY